MSFLNDFKKFAFKGNVVDLAVGVIIGGAFGKIISALVEDIIMPMVALVMPSGAWRSNGWVLREATDPKDHVVLKYGDFLGSVVDLVIIALVLFVVVGKVVRVAEAKLSGPAPEATTKPCPYCCESVPKAASKCRACASALA
jgi:large conductance mechanosensitive channel